jgi:hypothetical protein
MQTRRKRPKSVTFVAIGVITIGLLNAWRAVVIGQQSQLLLSAGVVLDPRIRLSMATVWAILFIVCGWLLWTRGGGWIRPKLHALIPVLLTLYALSQVAQQRWATETQPSPAIIALYGVSVLGAVGLLNLPSARRYSQRAGEFSAE